MSKRNLVLLVAALFMVFVMTVPALAENRVEVKVTSEPMPYHSTCTKAGGFSLEFDSNSVIRAREVYTNSAKRPYQFTNNTLDEYDEITIDLDYQVVGSTVENVTLCRPIDFMIAPGQDPVNTLANRYDAVADILLDTDISGAGNSTKDYPVYWRADTNGTDNNAIQGSIFFHIKGNVDAQTITIYVLGSIDGEIRVGGDTNDALVLHFLDQTCDANDLWWDETNGGEANGLFDDPIECDEEIEVRQGYDYTFGTTSYSSSRIISGVKEIVENTLCINVSAWEEGTTNGNIDSKDDEYTFIPSNPQIGHIRPAAEGFSLENCKTIRCGSIPIGAEQGGSCLFNPSSGTGFCSGTRYGQVVLMSTNALDQYSSDDEVLSITVYVRLMVNGATGSTSNDIGVYFAAGTSSAYFVPNSTDPCSYSTDDVAGSAVTENEQEDDDLSLADNHDCTETNSSSYISLNYSDVTASADANDYGILFTMPNIYYNREIVDDGDEVTAQVTVEIRYGGNICGGDTLQDTYCFGEFVDNCGAVSMLTYPYFTDYQDQSGYWNGIAITNMSGSDGTATLTIYEADGDVLRYTASIGAREVWADILYNMMGDMTFVTEEDGTIGNSRCWISVATDFSASGFAMISDWNNYGASMGYLPK
jgi:hypothetical protein